MARLRLGIVGCGDIARRHGVRIAELEELELVTARSAACASPMPRLGAHRELAPEPLTLYSAGALVDVGIYPLTMLTAMFGPRRWSGPPT